MIFQWKNMLFVTIIYVMTSTNNKLQCIITGRQLIATKDYYKRKVEKAGDEETLHKTYICREAKNLIKQGISVDRTREILDVDLTKVESVIDESIISDILSEEKSTRIRRINNIVTTSKTISNQTDPKVKQFITNILNE